MNIRQRELRAGVRAAIRARKAVKAMKAAVKVKPDAFTDKQIEEVMWRLSRNDFIVP